MLVRFHPAGDRPHLDSGQAGGDRYFRYSVFPARLSPVISDQPIRSTAQLLAGYAQILTELRARQVIRTNNAPAGDYGEWLVAKALGAVLEKNLSLKSYDLIDVSGARVQVKTRVVSDPIQRGQLQASVFRSFDFDLAALVQLRDLDYAVQRAVLLPVNVVEALSTRSEHVNGYRLLMTPAVLNHEAARDITDRARGAALSA
jgi:hypothetical protein